MHRTFLLACCNQSHDPTVRDLARATLEGDLDALPVLWDRLQETRGPVMQSLKVGECYLFHAGGRHYTGRVKSVSFTDVVLERAALLPYYGNYHDLLRTGNPPNVDPLPDEIILSTAAVVDAIPWKHPLPREPKGNGDEIPF